MLELIFSPFPILHTERLLLRQLRIEDVDEVFRMRSDPEIMRYIPRPIAQSKSDAIKLIRMMNRGIAKNENINWAITLKGQGKLIGIIGYPRHSVDYLRGEIGYLLDTAYHRKGIMQEALEEVIKYGFEKIKFHTIEGIIDPENIASEKLLLKNGFIKEAHFKENIFFEGKWMDSVHYTKFSPIKQKL